MNLAVYRVLGRHQFVIPKEAREKLGVKAGDLVVSYVERGRLITVPVKKVSNPLEALIVSGKPARIDAVKAVHEARER